MVYCLSCQIGLRICLQYQVFVAFILKRRLRKGKCQENIVSKAKEVQKVFVWVKWRPTVWNMCYNVAYMKIEPYLDKRSSVWWIERLVSSESNGFDIAPCVESISSRGLLNKQLPALYILLSYTKYKHKGTRFCHVSFQKPLADWSLSDTLGDVLPYLTDNLSQTPLICITMSLSACSIRNFPIDLLFFTVWSKQRRSVRAFAEIFGYSFTAE